MKISHKLFRALDWVMTEFYTNRGSLLRQGATSVRQDLGNGLVAVKLDPETFEPYVETA